MHIRVSASAWCLPAQVRMGVWLWIWLGACDYVRVSCGVCEGVSLHGVCVRLMCE